MDNQYKIIFEDSANEEFRSRVLSLRAQGYTLGQLAILTLSVLERDSESMTVKIFYVGL
jgi:hypothetical protein